MCRLYVLRLPRLSPLLQTVEIMNSKFFGEGQLGSKIGISGLGSEANRMMTGQVPGQLCKLVQETMMLECLQD